MMRNKQIDRNGKPHKPLSDAGQAYLAVRIAAPTMKRFYAAHAVALYGDQLPDMTAEEMGAAIEATKQAWETATKQERKIAAHRAHEWEKFPEVQAYLRLHQDRALAKADASLDRTVAELARLAYADARQVMSWGPDGVTLLASEELDDDAAATVAEVAEVLGKDGVRGVRVKMHSKTEALQALLRYFAPEKAVALTQNNLNIRILVTDADGNALKAG